MDLLRVLKAVLLGIVQGLTEFLPVSSSGHLVIGAQVLNFQEPGIVFEVFLHGGTLFAVILVFKQELQQMVRAFFTAPAVRRADPELARFFRWDINVIVATLPAVVVGLLLKDSIDRIFDSILIAYAMLSVSGVLMLLTPLLRDRGVQVTWPRALAIGVAQAMAIMPGLSRSGSTIFTGMLLGLNREKAARFSFIMSIPAIVGAMILEARDLFALPLPAGEFVAIVAGTVASLATGYGAIVLLLSIARRGKLYWFGYYCLAVSGIGFAWHFWG
jgi:undecaprenyl-diphosphatase